MLEVKRLRQAKEWNQTELAFHAGLAPSVISEIENGKRDPSARTLRKLAEALKVDVGDLFPKAQAPLPEFEDVRRVPLFIGAVLVAAQRWRTSLFDTDIRKVPGIVEAALDLAGQISPGLDRQSPRVPPYDFLLALDVLSLLREIAVQGTSRMELEAAPGDAPTKLVREYRRRLDETWDAGREKLTEALGAHAPEYRFSEGPASVVDDRIAAYEAFMHELMSSDSSTRASVND
ncbi:MAG TPA: helix-turn-helix transcriptional regulator [Rubrobacter sp.]|nr:helix-turn-helix transcriptional regulator [Rubrobacter sp.]